MKGVQFQIFSVKYSDLLEDRRIDDFNIYNFLILIIKKNRFHVTASVYST